MNIYCYMYIRSCLTGRMVSQRPATPRTISSAVQCNKIPDKISRLEVPQLYTAIVAAGDYKVLCKLKTGDSTLMLVGSLECVQAVASGDVPYLRVGRITAGITAVLSPPVGLKLA